MGFCISLLKFKAKYRIIKLFYHSTDVSVGNQKTDRFRGYNILDIGVRQGAVMSPLFFSIFINDLVTESEIRKVGGGVQIYEKLISILLFCIMLFADGKEELQKMLTVLSKFTEKWRLRVNQKKTKIIVFDPKLIIKRFLSITILLC